MFSFSHFLLKIKERWLAKFQFTLVLGQEEKIYMVTNHLFINASLGN